MEGNLPVRGMIPGASYGVMDLQGNMHMHHQQHTQTQQQQWSSPFQHQATKSHQQMHSSFLLGNQMQESDQQTGMSIKCCNKGDHAKISVSDEEQSLTEEGIDSRAEGGKERKESPWHRMKWTDAMVKLLITAVSYVGEDVSSDCHVGGRRKCAVLQKKGKWKAISKVMAERGCFVSPQQCEDKFNDLNKRYKRLTDILGRGTSCKVVENPVLLDRMNHISEKLKDDARKILSSKHLFYEEMCSYHNCNRLNLPADPALQRSLQLALRCKDEQSKRGSLEDIDEDEQSADSDDDEDDTKDHSVCHGVMDAPCFPKRLKLGVEHEELGHNNPVNLQACTSLQAQGVSMDMNQLCSEGSDSRWLKQQLSSHSLDLEEKMLQIEAQRVELKSKRLKWQMFSRKKDRELERMRMDNERMKMENERMSLEVRRMELELDHTIKRTQ